MVCSFTEQTVCGARVSAPSTLVDLLLHASTFPEDQGEHKAFEWLDENGVITQSLTYKELDKAARAVATLLIHNSAVGQPVLLLFEPGVDFLIGFFGCLYAGAIAVPLCPPLQNKDFAKLDNTVLDCDPKLALTSSFMNRQMHIHLYNPFTKGGFSMKKLNFICVDEVDMELASKWTRPAISPSSVAYIQYTSGSTSFPKGVLVTHGNGIYNSLAISKLTDTRSTDLALCWLPLFHDMGLVGNILSVMHTGMPVILMSPLSFLKRPELFMSLLSQFKITHVSAPNFAYDFCTRKIPDSLLSSIDLSHVRVALNASEHIYLQTLESFCKKFAPCGMSMDKFYPCYGLAEATLLVTASGIKSEPVLHKLEDTETSMKTGLFVGCGKSLPEGEVRVVDPESRKEKKTGKVGEIWVRSPSVAAGYYGNPVKTKEIFGARIVGDDGKESALTYLRTGDLGFLDEQGELYITGRQKDVINIRGKNLYPQDVEWLAQTTHSLIRPGSCVVFSYKKESIVLMAEVRREITAVERNCIIAEIKQAIAENFNGVVVHDVCLLKAGTIPKTTSGKVMRYACKHNYETGSYSRLKDKAPSLMDMVKSFPSKVVDKFVQIIVPQQELTKEYILKYLRSKVAQLTSAKQEKIDVHEDIRIYGFDSIRQMQLIRDLEDRLSCSLPATLFDLFPTIEQLADFILTEHSAKVTPTLFQEEEAQQSSSEEPLEANGVSSVEHIHRSLGELSEPEPVVIVGMACRVPQAKNVEQFWDNLMNGVDAITKVPEDRWDADAFYDPDSDKPGKIPTTQGGFVSDIDKFDAAFFNIGPREAEVMDPQQRQILEVTYEALESAGISKEKIKGSKTGVYMGVCFSDYHKIQAAEYQEIRPYVQTGCAHSVVANRISYFYDLHGPSLSVDTACSSSLVALHLAVQSIQSGEINAAIVGGTSANLVPEMFMAFAKLHMLSPDGRCKAFDSKGNGYVRSEGFTVLVVKPLSRALADGDPIRAVIRATGTNSDGKKSGLTFPGRESQEALLREVYTKSKLSPQDIQYIEAHGTGTPAGDPVEVNAVGNVLGLTRDSEKDPLLIGSVKSNIGHLEGASGIAGLIKTIKAMETGIIPSNLHFHEPNKDIDFDGMRLSVVAKPTPWPKCNIKRAGINSFGFGGSNAHVVLEYHPVFAAHRVPTPVANEYLPFILSGHTKQATEQLIAKFSDYVAKRDLDYEELRDISYTLACRRTQFLTRAAIVANSKQDLLAQLQSLKVAKIDNADERKLCFVFTGQGAQYFAMGRELMKENPLFLQTMKQCDAIIKKHMPWSLLEELAKSEADSLINRPDISQPACAALQISLVKVWETYGVSPTVVVGHSSGEIGAAYCAGILNLEDAMKAAIFRGIALRDTPSTTQGKMAAVSITDGEARELISSEKYKGKVDIAAVNSPSNVTLSGDAAEIDEIVASMKEKGTFAQVLRTERAYHSHHMRPVGAMLKNLLSGVVPAPVAKIPMISSVTGKLLDSTEVDGTYWMRNLTGTVQFCAALQAAYKEFNFHAAVEVGPHPALAGPTRQSLTPVASPVPLLVPTICRKEPETRRMLLTACALGDIGYDVQWNSFFPVDSRVVTDLPAIPWQSKPYWHEGMYSKMRRFPEQSHELLGARASHVHGAWVNSLRLDIVNYLVDHCVQGSVVFPGAGYIAMMIASSGATNDVIVEDVVFKTALVFENKDTPKKTQLALNSAPNSYPTSVSIFSENDKHEWQEHCSGKFTIGTPSLAENKFNKDKCTVYTSKEETYKTFNQMGLEYGPNFQGIDEMWRGDMEAYANISAPYCAVSAREAKSYLLHPTVLDASFQTLIGCISSLSGSYLPVKIAKINVIRPCHFPKYVVHAICTSANAQTLSGNITVFTPEGLECVSIQGLVCNSIGGGKKSNKEEIVWSNSSYEYLWKEDASTCVWNEAVSNEGIQWDPLPETLAVVGVHKAAESIKASNATVAPQFQKLYDWIQEFVQSSTAPANAPDFDLNSSNPEVVVTSRFATQLENILLGKTDPLGVMFGDEVIYNVYERGPTFSGASQSIRKALPYLIHKNSNMEILEIGAGTGGTTGHALKVFNNMFNSYTFTDISAGFFEKAKAKFAHSAHKMTFKPLDIENNPVSQGFKESGYDLIIATDVLHATKDITATLKNVLSLLKPGGILLMNEFINCPVWIQMVFGTLEGWWRFVDGEKRTMGPTLSEQGWNAVLKEAGFAHTSVLPDYASAPLHGTFLATKSPQPQTSEKSWYIVPDTTGFADALSSASAGKCIVAKSAEQIPPQSNVIYLPSLSPIIFEELSASALSDLQQLTRNSSRIVWVTSGASMDVQSPALAPIVGLSRTLRNEYPQLRSQTVDLDPSAAAQQNATTLLSLVDTLGEENEVAIRNKKLYIPRLVPANVSTAPTCTSKLLADSVVKLEIGTPGLLNSLQWIEYERAEVGEEEVELRVFATGVNFKDVMLSMGMLNADAVVGGFCGSKLGIECAGIVTKVGPNAGLKVGDRVVAVAQNSYSTYVRTPAPLAVKIPEGMTFEEAATIPATFLTAMYALYYLARLEKGETVLIHAAAGGVGQAAIQLCKLVGAEVFVTAGSDEKRKFLETEFQIPSDHIMSSRTLDFVEQIKAKTNGKGVDVVLNSLAGEFLFKSVSIVAPFGRFLEIGKRDIYSNSKLDMEPFGQNVSFFAIDLDRLNASKPRVAGKMFRDLMQLFEEGKLKPMPMKVYPFSKVEDAFRYLQAGKNIGKVVLSAEKTENIDVVTLPKSLSLKPNGIYLLVGGMGGFGRAVATWAIEKGAKHLAFVSRSGDSTPAAKQLIQDFAEKYPHVKLAVEAADVSNFEQLNTAVEKIKSTFQQPILGVVQMAMVLEDIVFDKTEPETFNKVVRPKAKGTENLERVAGTGLDFFVMFSSVSSVVGNFGQGSYAAANSYLDALAFQRHAKGLPATSINWGAIGEVGYVAERKDLREGMERRGIYTLPLKESLEALEYSIVNQLVQVVVAPIKWTVASNSLPILSTPQYAYVLQLERNESQAGASASAQGSSQVSHLQTVLAADPAERPQVVRQVVCEKLGGMLGVSGEDVEPTKKISDLGVDSLMAIEVKNWVDKEFNVQVSVLDLTGGKTVDDLSAKISSSLSSSSTTPAASPSASTPSAAPDGATDHFVCIKPVENAARRLVCFPYLGGTPASFDKLKQRVPENVEVWSWNPSPIATWAELIDVLATAPVFENSPPLLFYGHSLGGIVAFEVACRLQSQGKQVLGVVVGASGSPDKPAAFSKISEQWDDDTLIALPSEALVSGLLQAGIIENTTLTADVLRAEILLGRRHAAWNTPKKFDGTIVAIAGAKDSVLGGSATVESWQQFGKEFRFFQVAGGHLFLHDHAEEISGFLTQL